LTSAIDVCIPAVQPRATPARVDRVPSGPPVSLTQVLHVVSVPDPDPLPDPDPRAPNTACWAAALVRLDTDGDGAASRGDMLRAIRRDRQLADMLRVPPRIKVHGPAGSAERGRRLARGVPLPCDAMQLLQAHGAACTLTRFEARSTSSCDLYNTPPSTPHPTPSLPPPRPHPNPHPSLPPPRPGRRRHVRSLPGCFLHHQPWRLRLCEPPGAVRLPVRPQGGAAGAPWDVAGGGAAAFGATAAFGAPAADRAIRWRQRARPRRECGAGFRRCAGASAGQWAAARAAAWPGIGGGGWRGGGWQRSRLSNKPDTLAAGSGHEPG
jgi:hypothetical protein